MASPIKHHEKSHEHHIVARRFTPTASLTLKSLSLAVIINIASIASPVFAQNQNDSGKSKFPVPAALEKIADCQAIINDAERLKCYDVSVKEFSAATSRGDVIVAEKQTVDEARKDVFGLAVSDNPIFGNKDDEGVRSIESVLSSVRKRRDGKWVFTLENGASWRQTDTRSIRGIPKAGQKITIERALFGSFKATLEGRKKTIKVIRVR